MTVEDFSPGQIDDYCNGKQYASSPIPAEPGPEQGKERGGYEKGNGAVYFAHRGSVARIDGGQ